MRPTGLLKVEVDVTETRLLPVLRAQHRSVQHPSVRRSRAEIGKELRVVEASRSLNALSSASAAAARHDERHVRLHSKTRSSVDTPLAQRSILSGMCGRIEAYGEAPSDLSGQQASHVLLKSDDLYVPGSTDLAPYTPTLLKVTKSEVLQKMATELSLQDSA